MKLEETRPDGHGRARGLVSSRESGRRVEARTFAPRAELRGVVDCYWVTRWDLRGQPPHLAEMLSDPCVNVALERGRSRVVGVCTRLFTRELSGQGLIRAVKLRAGAARALFAGHPVAGLTDRITPLGSLFDDALSLEERVLSADDDRAGLALLESWLLSRVALPLDPELALAAAIVERIEASPDVVTAQQLSAVAGLSIRPLQRLFQKHVGASPKWLIRRFRLREAAARLERGEVESLASLAADLGYSDHAHLSRDFKAATGRAPSDFARSMRE